MPDACAATVASSAPVVVSQSRNPAVLATSSHQPTVRAQGYTNLASRMPAQGSQ